VLSEQIFGLTPLLLPFKGGGASLISVVNGKHTAQHHHDNPFIIHPFILKKRVTSRAVARLQKVSFNGRMG
jgi:hypothetical protein